MRLIVALAAALAAALVGCASAGAVIAGKPVRPPGQPAVVRLDGCTGTLITPTRILTAAHCARGLEPASSRVKIGDARYLVSRVARDPRYRYEEHSLEDSTPYAPPYDFAVAELDRAVVGVQPLPLLTEPVVPGQRAVTLGYGVARYDPAAPFGQLRSATVVVRTAAACRRAIAAADRKQRRLYRPGLMLCVQDPDRRAPYASACNGDSGSPLLVDVGGVTMIGGVDAWGVACGTRHNDPANYMTIPSGLAFITAADPPWMATPAGRTTITGTATVGSTLTCIPPPWAVAPSSAVRFDWQTKRGGASGADYVVRARDAGADITCRTEAPIAGGGTLYFASEPVHVDRPAPAS